MSKRNVFLAMGFAPEDAMVYAIRTDLADALAEYLKKSSLKQTDAAKRLGLPQGVVSDIMRGKIDHISVERLMRAMARIKMPGWAEWPTAEHARAGSGSFVATSVAMVPTARVGDKVPLVMTTTGAGTAFG